LGSGLAAGFFKNAAYRVELLNKKGDEMIFQIDEGSQKIIATIQRNDSAERYECSLLSCDNPVCACNTIYLNLSSLSDDNEKGYLLSSHSIDIDLIPQFSNNMLSDKTRKGPKSFMLN